MATNFRGSGKIFLASVITAMSGTLLLSSAVQAAPEHRGGFRSFFEQNPNMNRQEARQQFLQERRESAIDERSGAGHAVDPGFTLRQGPDGVIICGGPESKMSRHERLINTTRNQTFQQTANRVVRLNNGVDLDLTSQTKNITIGRNLLSDETASVAISVGGETKTLTAGSQVTAAEYVAVQQVLSGGVQKVSVDKAGRAIGGEVDLSALTDGNDVMRASALVVANNVTAYGDFGKRSDFRLLGDLDNYGTVQALSTDASVRGGAIRANDISNHTGASINSNVDLTLDASSNLLNNGSITSSGTLTLTAGGVMANSGTVSAQGDLNTNAAHVRNAGTLSSASGNVNLNGSSDASVALVVNNAGGTISANSGAINVRDTAYTGTGDSTVTGGDLFSSALNLNAGGGLTEVAVNELTGVVNGVGNAAHVLAATSVLNLGTICLTGDPTVFNTAGDININGDFTAGENLVLVASGDIIAASGVDLLAGAATSAFDITLIAGADFTASGTSSPTFPNPSFSSGAVSLSGKASKTGGSIVFGLTTTIRSQATAPAGNTVNSGSIELFAFAGKEEGSGSIDVSSTTIESLGSNNGSSGHVTIIGGAKQQIGIGVGDINLGTGSGTAGALVIQSAQPVSSEKKGRVEYLANGERTSSAHLIGGKQAAGDVALVGKLDVDQTGTIVTVSTNGKITNFDVIEGRSGSFAAGTDVSVRGNQTWITGVAINAGSAITSPNNSFINGGSALSLVALDSIGGEGTPLSIGNTSNARLEGGDGVYISSTRAGTLQLSGGSGGLYSVNAPSARLIIDNAQPITSEAAKFVISDYTNLAFKGTTFLDLETKNALFNVDDTFSNLNVLNLVSAGGIGVGSILQLSDVKLASLTAANDINVQAQGKKGVGFANIETPDDIRVESITKLVTINEVSSTNGQVVVDLRTGDAKLNFTGAVTAKTLINILSSALDPKPKNSITFAANSELTTTANTVGFGNIGISVGTAQAVNTEDQDNIVVQTTPPGQVFLKGQTIKAKSPDNILFADGAFININNGLKKGITFGGNVKITAH